MVREESVLSERSRVMTAFLKENSPPAMSMHSSLVSCGDTWNLW